MAQCIHVAEPVHQVLILKSWYQDLDATRRRTKFKSNNKSKQSREGECTAAGTSAKEGRENYDISFVAVHISHTGKQWDPYDLQ